MDGKGRRGRYLRAPTRLAIVISIVSQRDVTNLQQDSHISIAMTLVLWQDMPHHNCVVHHHALSIMNVHTRSKRASNMTYQSIYGTLHSDRPGGSVRSDNSQNKHPSRRGAAAGDAVASTHTEDLTPSKYRCMYGIGPCHARYTPAGGNGIQIQINAYHTCRRTDTSKDGLADLPTA